MSDHFLNLSGCQHLDIELEQRRVTQQREQYGPACEALGLVYTGVTRSRNHDSHGDRQVVCTGSDRVVTLDIEDLDETEVRMITNE